MDKKVFLAVTICAAIFLIWQNVYLKPLEQHRQGTATAQPAAKVEAPVHSVAPAQDKQAAASVARPQSVTLEGGAFHVTVSTKGGTVSSVSLAEYRGRKADLAFLIGGEGQLELNTPSQEWGYLAGVSYSVKNRDKDSAGHERLVLAYEDANVSLERTYTLVPDLFAVDHQAAIRFRKQPPAYLFVGLQAPRKIPKEHEENERRQIFFNRAGGQETWTVGDVDSVKEDLGQGNWLGFSSRYFLNALIDRGSVVPPQFQARPVDTSAVAASFFYKVPGESMQIPVRFYYGPKDVRVLKEAGKHLDAAVDFGWFTVFAYPLLKLLQWFNQYVHNFGIAIILLTVLVKLALYPLTLKSMKSMKEMQRIQPQLARLRERYKDDKERLNKEMLQLMRTNGYNPMSGCLPIFIQMPIFIALYNVLYGAIDLYGAPFFGWITDLSAKDPFYVTPIVLALMMFLQQKMTPSTATDPAQQKMMTMMPIIFGVMMLWLPAGLTLYMLVNSIVSIVQQLWINRSLNLGGSAGATAVA